MLLHPDGSEELLVRGGDGSIVDPVVSFDGQSVYYSHIHDLSKAGQGDLGKAGADIYKIQLPTRKITRLTDQTFTPNPGAAKAWTRDFRGEGKPGETYFGYGVYNMGPCPLPGGRLMFVSNRNGFRPPKHDGVTMQLFVMDEDGKNVEQIGHLNIGMALHPTVLMDGRVVFSSLESQGLRNSILWGLWSIHPDGTQWGPVISAFDTGQRAERVSLSDATLRRLDHRRGILQPEQQRFRGLFQAAAAAAGRLCRLWARFCRRSAQSAIPLRPLRQCPAEDLSAAVQPDRLGIVHAIRQQRRGAGRSVGAERQEFAGRRQVHASAAAPDNHLLTVWSPGPVNHQNFDHLPMPDGGIYLIKSGQPIDEPAQMRLIKNDPNYNEQWPRAVVPVSSASTASTSRHDWSRWPTTASIRRNCRTARRSAWSARRACTSARAIRTAPCRAAK